ncbi:hypothetical protein CEXT_386491 [Caerostris extrusa]|uniref:Uncharacterized protein n=1 Tax=Caerostris extrusa TaxID=172846 RepID=A0AAV4W823_CAEEX|nr:hypothetical protein CEXT_386491 [Caerostris extrusa]
MSFLARHGPALRPSEHFWFRGHCLDKIFPLQNGSDSACFGLTTEIWTCGKRYSWTSKWREKKNTHIYISSFPRPTRRKSIWFRDVCGNSDLKSAQKCLFGKTGASTLGHQPISGSVDTDWIKYFPSKGFDNACFGMGTEIPCDGEDI